MSPYPLRRTLPAALAALLALPLHAQQPTPAAADPADTAMRECARLAESRQVAEAQAPARRARELYEARLARRPGDVEALVGLARTISQCQLPAASFPEQGEMSTRAIELLDAALAHDPAHWTARFVLASILYRSPAFLGRAPRAAKELDLLLRMQGERTDDPGFARPFELRGRLWARAGQVDSARATWERGATLFPASGTLRALVDSVRAATPRPPDESPAAGVAPSLARVSVVARAVSRPSPAAERVVGRGAMLMTPGGTADVLQAVQLLPGATRVSEGSDVYTRGGDPSETALALDGGRLLSLSRFEGLNGGMFGALEPFVVTNVRYSSGGFSARHGNALSGVLEIETDGRPRERQLRTGMSLVQLAATARIPAGRKLGGWVSARSMWTGALLAAHGRGGEYDGSPRSHEVVASAIATPTPTSELRVTTLAEQDDARRVTDWQGYRGAFDATGALRAALVNGRWIASDRPLQLRANLAASWRTTDWRFGVLSRDRRERNIVARADAEWLPDGDVALRGGVEGGAYSRRDAGTVPTTEDVANGAPSRALDAARATAGQLGAWLESEWARGATRLVMGLRADRLPGERVTTFDPRLAIAHRRGDWTARVSTGLFHQGRWRAEPAIPDAGLPSGAPRSARHLVLGIEREGATTVRAEAYLKAYGDYVPFGAGPRVVDGSARGIDVIAQRAVGGAVTGWVGWSLLDATVTLADGRRARSPFDVTHSATASATWAIDANWSLGSTLRYGTGAPRTPVVGSRRDEDGRIEPVYGPSTSERLPDYLRADARLMRFIRTPKFLVTTFAELLNAGGRANAIGVTYDRNYDRKRPVETFFAKRMLVAGVEVQFR